MSAFSPAYSIPLDVLVRYVAKYDEAFVCVFCILRFGLKNDSVWMLNQSGLNI